MPDDLDVDHDDQEGRPPRASQGPMMARNRSFSTHREEPVVPEWGPLEIVACLSRRSPDLPSFHEWEFMYMGCLTNGSDGLRIHLYKHRDTRRYLNLDEAGHAYEFRGPSRSDVDDQNAGGRYRPAASLADAVEAADLRIFQRVPTFFRSCPPEEWPADATKACVLYGSIIASSL